MSWFYINGQWQPGGRGTRSCSSTTLAPGQCWYSDLHILQQSAEPVPALPTRWRITTYGDLANVLTEGRYPPVAAHRARVQGDCINNQGVTQRAQSTSGAFTSEGSLAHWPDLTCPAGTHFVRHQRLLVPVLTAGGEGTPITVVDVNPGARFAATADPNAQCLALAGAAMCSLQARMTGADGTDRAWDPDLGPPEYCQWGPYRLGLDQCQHLWDGSAYAGLGDPKTMAGGGNPSTANAQCHCVDPVNSATGELWEKVTDLALPGRAPVSADRTYSSLVGSAGGRRCDDEGHPGERLASHLHPGRRGGVHGARQHACHVEPRRRGGPAGTEHARNARVHGTGQYTFTRRAHEVMTFDTDGRLSSVKARARRSPGPAPSWRSPAPMAEP